MTKSKIRRKWILTATRNTIRSAIYYDGGIFHEKIGKNPTVTTMASFTPNGSYNIWNNGIGYANESGMMKKDWL